jgi:hypothetical protein
LAKAAATARIGYSSIIEGARSGGDVGDGLAALVAQIGHREVRTHLAQGVQEADAQGVQQHALDRHLRAWGDQRGHQRKGRRGGIARHADPRRRQLLAAGQHDAPPCALLAHLDLGAEGAEHPLGVVAGRLGLEHLRAAGGVQAGQQHRRLHLRRGFRQAVGDAPQVPAPQRQRQSPAVAADPARAHFAQRLQHPVHRASAQGIVAGEGGRDGESGGCAHDQPHARAGIAAIHHIGRLRKAAPALDPPAPLSEALDARAEGRHGGRRAFDVLALQQALDLGHAMGQRAQDQGAMRNGFVPRGAQNALQRAGAPGGHHRRRHWMETRLRGACSFRRGDCF